MDIFETLPTIFRWLMGINGIDSFYRIEAGGIPLTEQTYVERDADEKLRQFTQLNRVSSRMCFILAPRQTGKTSLMVKTIGQLPDEEFICIQLDFQEFSSSAESDETLYYSLLNQICRQISDIDADNYWVKLLNATWNETPDLDPKLRFKNFLIEHILKKKDDKKLIIFIDEIQNIIGYKQQNSFIGFIKSLSQSDRPVALRRLAFVLLGVARPTDLVTDYKVALNLGERIELGGLQESNCNPLWQGLEDITDDPQTVLSYILDWTGGQPFLTQALCHLVAVGRKIQDSTDIEEYIEKLVISNVIKDWRRQDRLYRLSHLEEIENWFIRVDSSQKLEKLAALSLYRKILNKDKIRFEQNDPKHWDLLISGLVARNNDDFLKVSNRIYEQVFTLNWVNEKEEALQEGMMADPLSRIYNRDVFMLIDQSASTLKKDGGEKTRWKLLEELITGHVATILERDDGSDAQVKICEQVYATTFNLNKYRGNFYMISDVDNVEDIFLENRPDANSFVVPTLRHCFDMWLNGREKVTLKDIKDGNEKGAFFIIYTDGQFDDPLAFEQFITETTLKVEDHRIIKILIIGLGKGVNVKYFDNLDTRRYKDAKGDDCNIVVFDLAEDLDEGIIELMQRQLRDSSKMRKGFSL
ncbi:AAA-like domain-containing protein [Funiculus sociatus GB2-A5]|uniref:AAA-like domain-containing protein n=1 Tax=Funiculus sociatus GB2-A5 TaxID=2933946 RepID=A0ABV0JNS6_9CYAN|nr:MULTISPECIES: AAA-like domain-containing protein [unclassified Trichocoleus]MBD1908562.1 AAA-like domain-containing protein [Trichocoleus sp. FACHB-832]MBD2063894.1 AAA-like domain-containing protein [Trichocoleus sp. FACHB-6]